MPEPPDHIISDAQSFNDPVAAVDRLCETYANAKTYLLEHFEKFAVGDRQKDKQDAQYPYLWIDVPKVDVKTRRSLSYGSVSNIGEYGTTITNPTLIRSYLLEQIELILSNYDTLIWVGISNRQIPITFALENLTADIKQEQVSQLTDKFHLPNLSDIDDDVANGTHRPTPGDPKPLSLFGAERIDYSLSRLRHYIGTLPEHFQSFVLFTNYQRYVDEFVQYSLSEIENGNSFRAFVEPGNKVHTNPGLTDAPALGEAATKLPQMPAYHLVRDGHVGVTLVNIGVGPSNAKTITDHVAVLRPHCWVMIGHCGGLHHT